MNPLLLYNQLENPSLHNLLENPSFYITLLVNLLNVVGHYDSIYPLQSLLIRFTDDRIHSWLYENDQFAQFLIPTNFVVLKSSILRPKFPSFINILI